MMLITVSGVALYSQPGGSQIEGEEVFRNEELVLNQIDEHTWVGSNIVAGGGNVYLVEGEDRAILFDAGSRITDLDKIVASITEKPVTLILTHIHPDHVGAVGYFPELYMNPGDTVQIPQMMPDYEGEIKFLKDGETIDLGGRKLEVIFTPSHTPGSTTFIDKDAGYGFSGDSFGSGNLLLFTGTFSDLIATCEKMKGVMEKEGIAFLYPGHYRGSNPETLQRLSDMITLSKDVLSGKVKGEETQGGRFGLDFAVRDYGVRINYGEQSLK